MTWGGGAARLPQAGMFGAFSAEGRYATPLALNGKTAYLRARLFLTQLSSGFALRLAGRTPAIRGCTKIARLFGFGPTGRGVGVVGGVVSIGSVVSLKDGAVGVHLETVAAGAV